MFKNSLIGLWLVSVCVIANAAEPIGGKLAAQINFDIPAQPLGVSLKQLADEAGIQILFEERIVKDVQAPALKARRSVSQALDFLLNNTGLEYTSKGSTVAVRKKGQPNTSTLEGSQGNISPGFNPTLRIQQSAEGRDAVPDDAAKLSEIIVTAQKRDERLQDVPVPVTAVSADALIAQNQLRLQDYYTLIPGLTVSPEASSPFQLISIRGITTGVATNPTVGITVDDVPYGSSTNLGGGPAVPDFDPADLTQVEVLRGPQGTLYGASSMGGLLKFVTVDPSTDGVTGRVEAGTSRVNNGSDLGYNARGSVNLPLGDTLAVRASGFTRRDPGYINNVQTGQRGVNEAEVSGGRLSALWKPSDAVSVKLSALYQNTKGNGNSDVDVPTAGYPQTTGLGDLQQSYLRGTGGYDRKFQAYSAILTAKVGIADLTSVTGYNINSFSDSFDITYLLGPYTQYGVPGTGFNGFGVAGTPALIKNTTDKLTQEVRLSVPIGERFDWLLGAFYTHEDSSYVESILAANPATGTVVASWGSFNNPTTYAEYAAFTDLTFHVTDRFDVQVGGRESEIRQTSSETDTGTYAPVFEGFPSPHVFPEADSKANAFTYLVTPRFRVSSDLMLYARLASGYRAGGANFNPGGMVPTQFNPDKTQNYEIGVKGDWLNHTLLVDASLYYIDWKDIQLSLTNPQTFAGYNANAGQAKSQGIELSAESRPLTGLTIAAWVVLSDAVLTESFPAASPAVGRSGDRLPYGSRFSANLSVQKDFPLGPLLTGFAAGSVSYVGVREGEFPSVYSTPPERQDFPAYAKTDLRAGAKYQSWTVNFFVNNVADKRGLLSGGINSSPPFAFNYIQPRTAGFSVSKAF
jgi:iron complex outermembrane receptor protein